jgi:hypothetical protein
MADLNNFQLVMSGINPTPLLEQIESHPELWNYDDSWVRKKPGSPIYKEDNIVLRYVTLGLDGPRLFLYEEDKARDVWTRPAFGILTAAHAIMFDLMRAIPGEHLGHVIITRLRPGEIIAPHIDKWHPAAGPVYWQRYQIPLAVSPGVSFQCGDEELYMQPGHAYWFNNQITHSVTNASTDDRISMLANIRPFS